MKYTKNDTDTVIRLELQRRLDFFFEKTKLPKTGTSKLHWLIGRTILLFIILAILPYVVTIPVWTHYIDYMILAWIGAKIGFLAGHGGNHGSISSKKEANELLGYSFDLFNGVSSFFWKVKHDFLHHFFTNIDGFDDDIETGNALRFSPEQPHRFWHYFQCIYFIPMYGLLYFLWIYFNDFKKLFTRKIGQTKIKKMGFADIFIMVGGKVIHVLFFIVLPLEVFGFWEMFWSYLFFLIVTGWRITIVFQIAHVQRKSIFPKPNPKTDKIETGFTISQIISTANFAPNSPSVQEGTGWLSNQIEHHLFPSISPEYYPKISRRVVIPVCKKFHLPYNEYSSLLTGFVDHWIHMWDMSFKPKKVLV